MYFWFWGELISDFQFTFCNGCFLKFIIKINQLIKKNNLLIIIANIDNSFIFNCCIFFSTVYFLFFFSFSPLTHCKGSSSSSKIDSQNINSFKCAKSCLFFSHLYFQDFAVCSKQQIRCVFLKRSVNRQPIIMNLVHTDNQSVGSVFFHAKMATFLWFLWKPISDIIFS